MKCDFWGITLCCICAVLLLPGAAGALRAQVAPPQDQFALLPQRVLPKLAGAFLGGASDGMVELLRNHYYRFEGRWPDANPQYWNPRQSWKNKWRDGDPELGERFWQSSRLLAWTTDGYHLFRTTDRMLTTVTVTISLFDAKRPFYLYLIEGALFWIVRTAGFHTTYSLIHPR